MKLFIDAIPNPWNTWDKDLWKETQNLDRKPSDFLITPNEHEADVVMIEHKEGDTYSNLQGKKFVFLVDGEIANADIDYLTTITTPMIEKNLALILTDSVTAIDGFKGIASRWNKPTRVPINMVYDGSPKVTDGGFTITCNGERTRDNLASVLKTYFAMCLYEDPEHEGELVCMQDVDIFSAQDLPFETFNNVHFHGLQPNPKMFKKIANSKLFISPYNGSGVPMNVVDAVMLGTPALVRDTEVNRSIFNWEECCFYRDDKELAKNIKFFSEIKTSDPKYVRIVKDQFDSISEGGGMLAKDSLHNLTKILTERFGNGKL